MTINTVNHVSASSNETKLEFTIMKASLIFFLIQYVSDTVKTFYTNSSSHKKKNNVPKDEAVAPYGLVSPTLPFMPLLSICGDLNFTQNTAQHTQHSIHPKRV